MHSIEAARVNDDLLETLTEACFSNARRLALRMQEIEGLQRKHEYAGPLGRFLLSNVPLDSVHRLSKTTPPSLLSVPCMRYLKEGEVWGYSAWLPGGGNEIAVLEEVQVEGWEAAKETYLDMLDIPHSRVGSIYIEERIIDSWSVLPGTYHEHGKNYVDAEAAGELNALLQECLSQHY